MRCLLVLIVLLCLGCSDPNQIDNDANAPPSDLDGDRGDGLLEMDVDDVRDGELVEVDETDVEDMPTDQAVTPNEAVAINEIDCQGRDWVEFANTGEDEIDLTGWIVADQPDPTHGYQLEDGARLDAHGYYLVREEDGDEAGFDFGIACEADTLYLFDSQPVLHSSVPVGARVDGATWGRLPDGVGEFHVTAPTPGMTNQALLPTVIEPPGGPFSEAISVTILPADDASAYYTLDGTLPAVELTADGPQLIGSTQLYEEPIQLSGPATVRALSATDFGIGDVVSQPYVHIAEDIAEFSSNLPIVVLHSFEVAPTRPRDDIRTPFTMTILEPAEERATIVGTPTLNVRVGLDVRGNTSFSHPKKPYAVEIWGHAVDDDVDVSVLGMPAESDWAFYAPIVYDRALIRNALVYEWGNDTGRYAPRTRFAEVFVTDEGDSVREEDYVGVYSIIESVKRSDNRIDIARLAEDDITHPEITGGYIFKEDWLPRGETGFEAGRADGAFRFDGHPLVWSYPSESELVPLQIDYFVGQLDQFGDALAADDHLNPDSGLHYSEFIDVDSWIDFHIVQTLTKNPDSFRRSTYFHKDREGPIAAGPLWDFDRSMGSAEDDRSSDPARWGHDSHFYRYGWWGALFQDPWFSEQYWSRWEELLEDELSVEALHASVDRMADQLTEAAPRNFARWDEYPPRGGSFEAEIELLKTWLSERHAWITACLEEDAEERWSCGP